MTAYAGRVVPVGKISGAFGVRGWVRVRSYTDPHDNILRYTPWLLGESKRSIEVLEGAAQARGIVARLRGVDDRDAAQALAGTPIYVPRDSLGEAGTREYFWADLIGLRVINIRGVELGRVTDMLATGANDVMVVTGERRRLLPFVVGSVVLVVDIYAGYVKVDWDENF
jgi:16S rRNA processing protein RimM